MNLQCSTASLCRTKGNTIAEYVFIAVLILTASLFVLLNFGHGFKERILGLKDESSLHAKQAADIQERIRTDAALSAVTTIPGVGGKDGNYLLDTIVVQATGSNGDTSNSGVYGNTGKSHSGGGQRTTLTNRLKTMVTKLANQAHQIAQMEGLLSSISKYSEGSTQKFTTTNLYFQGKLMNADQLAAVLTQGNAMRALQRQKNAIMESRASQNLKNTISHLTDAVMKTAVDTSHQVASGSTNVDHQASSDTHQNAGSICRAGGNYDNGRRCGERD